MALSAKLEIRGLKELDELLAKLPDEVDGLIMQTALREAGQVILDAARANIPKRSGRTAADLRMDVQVQFGRRQGVAAIGGTTKKKGRAHILRWLEFGTAAHTIVAGRPDRKQAQQAIRALKALGETDATRALRRRIRSGSIRFKRALKLPSGVFRKAVQHPGTRPQSPLTRALFDHGDRAIAVYAAAIMREITAWTQRLRKAA